MFSNPQALVGILGGTLIYGVVMYVVVNQIMDSQNVTGGLWETGLYLLGVIPVVAVVGILFQ